MLADNSYQPEQQGAEAMEEDFVTAANMDTHAEWLAGLKMAVSMNGADTYDKINAGCEGLFSVIERMFSEAGEDPLTLLLGLLDRLITLEDHEPAASGLIMPVLALAVGTERAARREGLPSHLPVRERP